MPHANFQLDLKKLSDAGQIEGLAAGYGNVDAHGDIFAPGAFAKSIAAHGSGRAPAMLLHHDPQRPAGRWDEFRETPGGLAVRGTLALDAADGREAYALLKAGALTGLSVGFRTLADQRGKDGGSIITDAELFEVSLVAVPSNPLTKVSAVKAIGSKRDLEEVLREGGFSSRRAKAAASLAWQAVETSDTTDTNIKAIRLLTDANAALRALIGD